MAFFKMCLSDNLQDAADCGGLAHILCSNQFISAALGIPEVLGCLIREFKDTKNPGVVK